MKLFHQLTDEQRHSAIHYCLDIVVHNMIEDNGAEIYPEDDDEEIEMKSKLNEAIEHIKQYTDMADKLDYLMSDDDINGMLHQIAENVCQTAYYHSDDEMVIFEGEITDEAPKEGEMSKDIVVSNAGDKKLLN